MKDEKIISNNKSETWTLETFFVSVEKSLSITFNENNKDREDPIKNIIIQNKTYPSVKIVEEQMKKWKHF